MCRGKRGKITLNLCYLVYLVLFSIFSLTYLGLNPKGVPLHLQAFIYKTYCLGKFTYALETTTLTQTSIGTLNITQNSLIRDS